MGEEKVSSLNRLLESLGRGRMLGFYPLKKCPSSGLIMVNSGPEAFLLRRIIFANPHPVEALSILGRIKFRAPVFQSKVYSVRS